MALVWTLLGAILAFLIWPRGRTIARQIYALAALSFKEGLRQKALWTVLALSLIPGAIAYFSDADGTHAGRARLILDACISSGEMLGATLIVLLSALSVAREIESRIMHTLGCKPVPRWTILIGKAAGFWALDLCFLILLTAYCAVLVRGVPLRVETHAHSALEESGTWAILQRNALTTRIYHDADTLSASTAEFQFIRPGTSREWTFNVPMEETQQRQQSLRFAISSNNSMLPHIPDVKISAAALGRPPFFERTENIPQGRPFEFFLDPHSMPTGAIKVIVSAPAHAPTSNFPPISLIVARKSGIRLGVEEDGFATNLLKSFLLMAVQGWVLALITASWSGVLSFSVTVAMGVIFVLSGEMSRNVIDLLRTETMRLHESGLVRTAVSVQTQTIERLQTVLSMFPDFRAGGGPAAFVDGQYVPWLALAHAVFWMGLIRGVGWAIPAIFAFQRREIGK